jgi:hypothetical protein
VAVLIYEFLDESLVLMANQLKWNISDIVHSGGCRKSGDMLTVDGFFSIDALIRHHNASVLQQVAKNYPRDEAVYVASLQRLRRGVQCYKGNFTADLITFRTALVSEMMHLVLFPLLVPCVSYIYDCNICYCYIHFSSE